MKTTRVKQVVSSRSVSVRTIPQTFTPSHCLTKCKTDLRFKTTLKLCLAPNRALPLISLPQTGLPDVLRQAVRSRTPTASHGLSCSKVSSLLAQHPVSLPASTSSAVPPTYRQVSLTCVIQTPPLSVPPPPWVSSVPSRNVIQCFWMVIFAPIFRGSRVVIVLNKDICSSLVL
jgi:hypothetical protein